MKSTSRSGFLALLFVYLVWGSSFLGIRLAVSGANSFEPYTLAALRTFSAGLILLLLALLQGQSLRLPRKTLLWLALTGCLLWIGGHALVIWSERRMDSGLAALIFASTPLWGAMIEAFRGKKFGLAGWVPVLLGFVGVGLVLPLSGDLSGGLWIDGAALLLSAFFWAMGTYLGEGPAHTLPIALTTGWQLFFAGTGNALIAILAGETWANPSASALLAAGYLVVFGTVLAFLAYAHAMRSMPYQWLMSFGYVNPVVAVLLGFVFLGERIGTKSLAGMVVVIGSVIWLFTRQKGGEEWQS